MANYNNLKATINANIKANGNEEITGPILNTVLNQAVTTLGDGWSYKGIATPSMSPGTPDSNVFYIATTAGTYTNFGSLVVAEGEMAILKYNGSWTKEVTGAATAAQVTQLGQKVDEFAQGKFYGYFNNAEDLPTGEEETGFAYVGTAAPFAVYNYDGAEWVDSGVTVDRIPAGNGEDIDYNAEGLLQFADRNYDSDNPDGMGYVILRKNKSFAEQVTREKTIYEIRHQFTLYEDFTMPANCVLDFRGGSIDGAYTLNLNNCQIIGTNEWVGQSLTIAGKSSTPCYADWYAGTDADKIERAISMFGVVNLNSRDYNIERSINVNIPFSLIGQSLPGNFGTMSRTRLVATAEIDCILNITKGGTYISSNIERVTFTTDVSSRRAVNGINFSTPGGPSRPFGIRACNFRGLKYGIYVYGSDENHSTNLFNLSLIACNISSNGWGIYSEGRNGLGCLGVSDCVIEQNTQGGIYVHDSSGLAMFGGCIIRNNLMEGQAVPIDVQTSGSVIIEGNYFETSSLACDVRVSGYSGLANSPVKIFGNHHSNNGASLFTYSLSRCNIFELEDSGAVNYNVSLSYCFLQKLPNSRTKITSCNMVAVLDEGDGTSFDVPTFSADLYANYIANGVPSLRRIGPNQLYSRNYTRTIPVGDYRCIFYVKSTSSNNAFYLFDSANSIDFSKAVMPTSGKVIKFVHDISLNNQIAGTNKFIYGFRNSSQDDAMVSGLVIYQKGTSIPNIPLRAIPVSETSGSNFLNPISGDNFLFQGSRGVIGYDVFDKRWKNFMGMTPALSFGTTDERPNDILKASDEGFPFFDTTKKLWLRMAVGYNRISNTNLPAGTTQRFIANPLTTGKQYRLTIGQFNNLNQISVKFCKTNSSTDDSIDIPITEMTGSAGTSARATELFECPDTSIYPYIYLHSNYTGMTFFYFYDIIKSWLTFSGEVPEAKSGPTSARPDAVLVGAGFTYFDTDLGKMIVSNGSAWVNMDGSALS